MPAPIQAAILTPEKTRYRIKPEPAVNALQSLMMLARVGHHSGFGAWVTETAEAMSDEMFKRNQVVLFGLHYTLTPDRSYESFPAYIESLEKTDPIALRDKCINAYLSLPCRVEKEQPSLEHILKSVENFLDFLRSRFDDEHIIEEVERESYKLLKNPAAMQDLIVEHLRTMWDRYLREEWERVLPLINESVAAFERVDLEGMDDRAVMEYITGQKHEKSLEWLGSIDSIIFVPSAHAGPYAMPLHSDDTAWIAFGARQPTGIDRGISDLTRMELLVWLSALSDDTRLRTLALIREHDELCAQEIIDMLGLSQSSCSRHLRQLTASGYLRERRTEAGKCYSLNPDRLLETARAIERYAS